MRRKKVLFIVNPRSGKGQIRNALLDIADIFIKGGLDAVSYTHLKSVELMKEHIKKTMRSEVLTNIGGFSCALSMEKFKDCLLYTSECDRLHSVWDDPAGHMAENGESFTDPAS